MEVSKELTLSVVDSFEKENSFSLILFPNNWFKDDLATFDSDRQITKVESEEQGDNDANTKVREVYKESSESTVLTKDDEEVSSTIVTGTEED